MRKLFVLVVLMIGVASLKAQQDPQFSQNMFNRLFPNPAVAGANDAICATLIGREQWVGFEGQPGTYLFTAHSPVNLLHGGVGLAIAQDQIGQIQDFHAKLSYAYRMSFWKGQISAGIGIGMLQKTIGADWRFNDPNDPNINSAPWTQTAFDLDLGFYYQDNDLYAGISATHLPSADLQDATGSNANFNIARTYYLQAGYNYPLTPSITLQPSIFAKSDGKVAQFDINVMAVYNDFVWGGLTYRLQDAVVPMVGYLHQMNGNGFAGGTLKIGYSYDVTTSLIRTGSTGSHELVLNYCFNIPRPVKVSRHKSVRYL